MTLHYIPYRKINIISTKTWWRPNWLVQNSTEIILAPVSSQNGCVCWNIETAIFKCDLQPGKHIYRQHLLVITAIQFQSFNFAPKAISKSSVATTAKGMTHVFHYKKKKSRPMKRRIGLRQVPSPPIFSSSVKLILLGDTWEELLLLNIVWFQP